ncbi:MAG: S-layer homology domain-containing protein [bacterium]|nr:S-layer homology domain-containing protein [bacterium]
MNRTVAGACGPVSERGRRFCGRGRRAFGLRAGLVLALVALVGSLWLAGPAGAQRTAPMVSGVGQTLGFSYFMRADTLAQGFTTGSHDRGYVMVSDALTFTTANWNTPQQVTVTGVLKGASTISHAITTDSDYTSVTVADVTATVHQTEYSITSAVTIPETNAARGLTVTLGRQAPAGGITFTVVYDYSGSTATAIDLKEAPTTVTVKEGDTTATLRIVTRHDEVVEDVETFTVTITADATAQAAGWTPISGQNTATVTITDDDTEQARVGFWSASEPKPDGIAQARNVGRTPVSVALSRSPQTPITVDIEVDPSSTATEYADDQNPGDFRIPDKTVTFTPGGARGHFQTLWVEITNTAETANETIVLRIVDHSGNDLGRHYMRYAPNRTFTITLWPRTQNGSRSTQDGTGSSGPTGGGGGPTGGGGGPTGGGGGPTGGGGGPTGGIGDTDTGDDDEAVQGAGFVDVDPGSVHAANIDAVAAAGITVGCDVEPLRFCPDEPVTRAQMATFLVRALDLPTGVTAGFADVDPGSVHAVNIDAVAAAGITGDCGVEPLRFCPDEPVTRARMATFLVRALDLR